MKAYEIGVTPAFPNGAAATAPEFLPSIGITEWPGTNGAKCFLNPIEPTPGPPPPWGIENVLCKFKCPTSAPISPGAVSPS